MINNPEKYENDVLLNLNKEIYKYNPMTDEQRKFINGIIR